MSRVGGTKITKSSLKDCSICMLPLFGGVAAIFTKKANYIIIIIKKNVLAHWPYHNIILAHCPYLMVMSASCINSFCYNYSLRPAIRQCAVKLPRTKLQKIV